MLGTMLDVWKEDTGLYRHLDGQRRPLCVTSTCSDSLRDFDTCRTGRIHFETPIDLVPRPPEGYHCLNGVRAVIEAHMAFVFRKA